MFISTELYQRSVAATEQSYTTGLQHTIMSVENMFMDHPAIDMRSDGRYIGVYADKIMPVLFDKSPKIISR